MEKLNGNAFLVFGCFFMENTNGPGAYAKNFSGFLSFDAGLPRGTLEDCYGPSIITSSRAMSDEEIVFTKEYEDKNVFTYFFFRENNGLWQGYYRNEKTANALGLAQCVLVPYPQNYRDPIETIKFLQSKGMDNYQIPLIDCFLLSNILEKMKK